MAAPQNVIPIKYVKMYCHGELRDVPVHNPRCIFCGKRLKVVW